MNAIEYKKVRKTSIALFDKIMGYSDPSKQDLYYAAKTIGLWNGEAMVFESEEDMSYILDFLLYEGNQKGVKMIDTFYDSDEVLSDFEEEILEGMMDAYASFFEIKDIDPVKGQMVLTDLLAKDKKEYVLMEINLSKTAHIGLIGFFRLIPVKEVFMSSGIGCFFHQGFKKKILSELALARVKRKLSAKQLFTYAVTKNSLYGVESRTEDVR